MIRALVVRTTRCWPMRTGPSSSGSPATPAPASPTTARPPCGCSPRSPSTLLLDVRDCPGRRSRRPAVPTTSWALPVDALEPGQRRPRPRGRPQRGERRRGALPAQALHVRGAARPARALRGVPGRRRRRPAGRAVRHRPGYSGRCAAAPAAPSPRACPRTPCTLVARALHESDQPLSAADAAASTGVSRVTARRYLEHLPRPVGPGAPPATAAAGPRTPTARPEPAPGRVSHLAGWTLVPRPLVLASASPARLGLLRAAGLAPEVHRQRGRRGRRHRQPTARWSWRWPCARPAPWPTAAAPTRWSSAATRCSTSTARRSASRRTPEEARARWRARCAAAPARCSPGHCVHRHRHRPRRRSASAATVVRFGTPDRRRARRPTSPPASRCTSPAPSPSTAARAPFVDGIDGDPGNVHRAVPAAAAHAAGRARRHDRWTCGR